MKRWIWGGLVLFFVLFSLLPAGYELLRRSDLHQGRYFELVHNFYTDYNFYLSRIRQGREGAWTATEKYTSEPHDGSYFQIMYVLMGKVSAWIGVPWHRSGDTYHAARIVLAGALLFMMSYAAKTAFSNFGWAVTAFLLAVTASSVPILVLPDGHWRLGGYMPWWSVMDSLQRITFIPHLLAGQMIILFLLLALSSVSSMKRAGNWFFLGVLAFILGIIFPPGLLFTGVAWACFVVLDGVLTWPFKEKKVFVQWARNRIVGPAVVFLISAPTALYLTLMIRIYPWKRLVDFDLLHPHPIILSEYLLAVGPMVIFGALGAIWAIGKREMKLYVFIAWVIAWFVLVNAFGYVSGTSPLRISEMLPNLPLGILAAYLSSRLFKHSRLFLFIPIALITLGLAHMYSSWLWQKDFIDHKIRATLPLVPTGSTVMYPMKDFVDAIVFIQNRTKRTDVILSETTAGNYIPVYSGNTVYVGHANTVATEQKEVTVRAFFAGKMTVQKAQEFLGANNLHTVFFGPQEMEDGGIKDLSAAYPFLREIYKNPIVRVYTW